MLREFPSRIDGTHLRRQFIDDWMELFVWSDDTSGVSSFQMRYDRLGTAGVLTWREDRGFELAAGDSVPTPPPFALLTQEFEQRSAWIGAGLQRVIHETLLGAAPQMPPPPESFAASSPQP
jgi:hypothetical protein